VKDVEIADRLDNLEKMRVRVYPKHKYPGDLIPKSPYVCRDIEEVEREFLKLNDESLYAVEKSYVLEYYSLWIYNIPYIQTYERVLHIKADATDELND
jgi:hypothetical protein